MALEWFPSGYCSEQRPDARGQRHREAALASAGSLWGLTGDASLDRYPRPASGG
jgi:hypothetical protein